MDEVQALAERFVSVWNERDPERRRAMVHSLWAMDGRHLMGTQDVRGYEALEERVTASNRHNVVDKGYVFRPPTVIQSLPGVIKFRWDMARRDSGDVVSNGVGFLVVDDRGRIRCDYLFAES
jgi:hypothetical protein